MGNICRSPTAEAVFRQYVENAGLSDCMKSIRRGRTIITSGRHRCARSTQHAAQQRGYDMSAFARRQVERAIFIAFD